MYRHPGQDITKFSEANKLPCFIAGDINIYLTKYSTHSATNNYLENLLLYNAIPTIVMPTRTRSFCYNNRPHIFPARN